MSSKKYYLISNYQAMELLGVNGLFTSTSVDRESLPEGFYKYSIREGDNGISTKYMGDFLCKKELDMNGQDECELFGEYSFTGDEVNLDEFFGEDIKLKVAGELESLYYDNFYFDYQDALETDQTREDVVANIRLQLDDKKMLNGIIDDTKEWLSEVGEDAELFEKVSTLISVLTDINAKNLDSLDCIIETASGVKDGQARGGPDKLSELQPQ